jgi:hypothetical protein
MTRLLKITVVCQGASMLFYPAALPLSRQTLSYTAGVIRRYRRQIGSAWRKLNPGQQALLVLAYLRKGETFADLAAGFGVGTATAWRYVTETVGLLAARSAKLHKALAQAKKAGHAYVVIDGTLIPIDRVAADRPFYSGKHPPPQHEPAKSSPAPTARSCGVRSAARRGSRPDRRPDLGHRPRTGRLRADRAGGQGLVGAGSMTIMRFR